MSKRILLPLASVVAVLTVQMLGTPPSLAASAAPSLTCTPKPAKTPPPETSESANKEETVNGVIVAVRTFAGSSVIEVRRSSGMIIEVDLAPDTIISPPGAELRRGMHVTVKGNTVGCVFTAHEIATSFY